MTLMTTECMARRGQDHLDYLRKTCAWAWTVGTVLALSHPSPANSAVPVKISDLNACSAAASTDLLEIETAAGASCKQTLSGLSAGITGYLPLAGGTMTGDAVFTGTAKITMAGGVYTPTANGGPVTAMTTGSTVTGATNEGIRKSMFSLFSTNTSDEDSTALSVYMIQRSHVNPFARSGIACLSYTEPDAGGESSCIFADSTGGGTAATFYVRPEKRPGGYTDYSLTSQQPAVEIGTSAGRPGLLAISGIAGTGTYKAPAIRVRIDNAVSEGIGIEPSDVSFDSRLAFYVGSWQQNADPINVRYKLLLNGQSTISPNSALPPFVLGANAQAQKVVGLEADLLDGSSASTTAGAAVIPIADGSGKIPSGFLTEVLALTDLSGVAATTGSGTTAVLSGGPSLTNTVTITGDNPLVIQRGSGTLGVGSGIAFKDQAGNNKAAVGTEGAATNDLQLMSTTAIQFYTNSNLISTGQVLTLKTNGALVTAGAAPTISCTGTGTSPPAPTIVGSDLAFVGTINTGTGSPGSTGTCTVTFSAAYATNMPVMSCMLVSGAAAWGNGSTIQITTESLSAPVLTWTNLVGGTATALTVSTSYKFSCLVVGK